MLTCPWAETDLAVTSEVSTLIQIAEFTVGFSTLLLPLMQLCAGYATNAKWCLLENQADGALEFNIWDALLITPSSK